MLCSLLRFSCRKTVHQQLRTTIGNTIPGHFHKVSLGGSGEEQKHIYRVSQKTWTFFQTCIIPLFIKESFQNFVWSWRNNKNSIYSSSQTGSDIIMMSNCIYDVIIFFIRIVVNTYGINWKNH